jgi:glycine oxidase
MLVVSRSKKSRRSVLSNSPRDVVVIGAGVIGTAVAYFLGKEGLKVTVMDDRPLGSGCTFHGTGLVWKMIWNDKDQYRLAMEGRDLLFEAVPQIQEESGIDTLLHTFDTILPIFDYEDALRVERDVETGDGDIELQWLDREEVLTIEPRINPEVQRGAFLEGSAQIDGYQLTLAQAKASRLTDVEFLSLKATGLERQSGRVTAVTHTGGRISCNAVVICMGAMASTASEWLDFPVPIKPLKGETLRVRHPEPFPVQVYRPSGGGVSPRKDGILSVGATGTNRFSDLPGDLVKVDYDTEATSEGREYMLGASQYVIPEMARAEVVYHVAGSRPLSADGLPIIGPVPGLDGAYIATGHRNKGIHLSTVTARIIRDFVTRGKAEIRTPLEKFLPQRFMGKEAVEFNVPGVTV